MAKFPEIATTEQNFNVKASLSKNRLRGLAALLRGYYGEYALATLALAGAALLNIAGFLIIRHLVDTILIAPFAGMLGSIALIALMYISVSFVRGFLSFFSGDLAAKSAEGVAVRLKDYLFDHLQRLSFTFHSKWGTGELIQRVTSDVDTIRRFFAEQAIGLGRIFILLIANFGAMLLLYWPLALASVVVVPIVSLISIFFFQRVSKAFNDYQDQEAVLNRTLQENLAGMRVVKAFARQGYEMERFEEENVKKFRLGVRFMSMHAVYWPMTDLLCGLQASVGYFLGAMLTINGTISLGTYIAYSSMLWWLIEPIRNLGRLIVQISEGMVSYNRISEIVEEDWEDLGQDRSAPVASLKGHLVFKDVGFEYDTGRPVLQHISFEVKPGQTIALLGSTGSGKSSLMNLLMRFYDYTSGEILLDGHPLRDYPRYWLREQIGIVEQEPFLFSRTIRENICYGVHREVSDAELEKAARAAAIHEVILGFPEGYKTLVGERGVTLSGGQKQRTTLARTLLKNPRILILDDATSSVDTETESDIREALDDLMHSRTTFVIAHRIQSVMTADLIVVLDKGHVVQMGTHDELMRDEAGMYRRTYDMQAKIETELQMELSDVR